MAKRTPAYILAARVRQLRRQRKLSVTALASLAAMPREEVSRIENGHSQNPTLDRMSALAKALGVPVSNLLS